MARDSRRADPRRVVAVNGGGGGGDGGATVRCKLELILLTLLLTIIIPPAYAESQGESPIFIHNTFLSSLSFITFSLAMTLDASS